MKIIFVIFFSIICFFLGIIITLALTPLIGSLDIDTSDDAKDVLLLNFKIPPEVIINKTNSKYITLKINRK